MQELIVHPIGTVRSSFRERVQAPRQAGIRAASPAQIELCPGRNFEDALSDLASFKHIWVIYWFHLNHGWRPKVRPPRSTTKRGVFATRSPYRPNPLGMSLVKLLGIEGLTLHIETADMLDGTPVIDLKPFIAYADQPAEVTDEGWLVQAADPVPRYGVLFEERARAQLDFLAANGLDLETPLQQALELGPTPHAYRRIKRDGSAWCLAHKDWRARFAIADREIILLSIATGYRQRQLAEQPELELARRFVEAFGYPGHAASGA